MVGRLKTSRRCWRRLWVQYADDADEKVRAQTSSAISVLQTRYDGEKLLGMLIKNDMYGPSSVVRLLSQDKTYSLLVKWATDGKSVDDVTTWLRSVGSKEQAPRIMIDRLVRYYDKIFTPIKNGHTPLGLGLTKYGYGPFKFKYLDY
ncbi:hypothetical protein PHMEG_00017282 [Phytophthora megakarya]|uniref:RxLR effector protein n=1 Tax=Phytophthora megakarya TaxID=4795 RepID=A0A225VYA6_9STRA|nr:hypothetical protein PHMEG_00017282 [Phytophthora megakarya]